VKVDSDNGKDANSGRFEVRPRRAPAEDGLGAGREAEPVIPREDAAGGGEQDAIGWLPAWTAGLAFEDAELVAEGEDLRSESGVGVTGTIRISRRRRMPAQARSRA